MKPTVMLLYVIGYSEAPHIFKFTQMTFVHHAENITRRCNLSKSEKFPLKDISDDTWKTT